MLSLVLRENGLEDSHAMEILSQPYMGARMNFKFNLVCGENKFIPPPLKMQNIIFLLAFDFGGPYLALCSNVRNCVSKTM